MTFHANLKLLAVDWYETIYNEGACVATGNKDFFSNDSVRKTKAIGVCNTCPVRRECLLYAFVAHEPAGVWGGLDTSARQALALDARRNSDLSPAAQVWYEPSWNELLRSLESIIDPVEIEASSIQEVKTRVSVRN